MNIDTLIAELTRAKEEGAEMVLFQVNAGGQGMQAAPTFSLHDPNMKGVYVVGGMAIDWRES